MENVDKYRLLFENMNEGLVIDRLVYNEQGAVVDWIILDVNPAYEAIMGRSKDEVVGQRASTVYGSKEAIAPYLDTFGQVAATGTPTRLEFYAEQFNKYLLSSIFPAGPEQVGVTFVDITDRKQAETQRAFQANILQNVRDAIYVTDLEGRTIYWNKGAEALFGYTAAEMEGQTPACLYPDQEPAQLAADLQNILDGQDFHGEWQGRHKDGSPVWVDIRTTLLRDAEGEVIGFIGVSKDITERKQLEEALRTKEERYARAVEAGNVGVWEWNLETDEMYLDPHLKRMLEFEEHEIENHMDDWSRRVHPDDAEQVMAQAQAHIEGRTDRYEVEHRMLTKGGFTRWFLARGMVSRNAAGHAQYMVGTDTDITERKQAEHKLRENQVQLQLTIQAARLGLWDWDIQTGTVYYSPEWKRQLGYTETELSKDFDELKSRIHPEDRERVLASLDAYLENPWPDYVDEVRFRHKDGSYRWMLVQATLLVGASGRPYRLLGSHIDITERKQVEIALRESEENFQTLLSTITDYVWSANIVEGQVEYRYYSPVVEQITGYSVEQMMSGVDAWLNIIHPEDRPGIERDVEKEFSGEVVAHEYRIIRPDGEIRWLFGTTSPTLDEHGQVIRLDGVVSDITERKRVEETLQESERRLATLMSNLPGMAYRCRNDRNWSMEFVSDGCFELTGYQPDELLRNSAVAYGQLVHPDDRERVWQTVQTAVNKREPFEVTYRLTTAGGEEKWVWERGRGIFDEEQETVMLEGFINDITGRKQAEAALKQTNDLLEAVIQSAPAAIITTDLQGNVTLWSPAAEQIFGWSAAEVIGRPHPIVPKEKWAEFQSFINSVKAGQSFSDVEIRRKRKDGTLIDVSLSTAPLRDAAGAVKGALGILTDITRRKQQAAILKQYTNRLESLRQIDRAILAAQSPQEISKAALQRLAQLVPYQRAGVAEVNFERQELEVLVSYTNGHTDFEAGTRLPLDKLLLNIDQLQQDQIYQVEDYGALANPPPLVERIRQEGLRASLAVPLNVNERLIGALGLGRAEPGVFTVEEIEIARQVADQLAIAIRQARLLEAERDQRRLAEALSDTARILNSSLAAEDVLDDILANAGRVVPHEAGDILLVGEDGVVNIARQQGYDKFGQAEWSATMSYPLKDFPVLQAIARSKKAQLISDTHADEDWVVIPETHWIRSYVCAPLFKGEQLFGFVSLSHTTPGFYNAAHAGRLQLFAEQAGIALQNAYLYEQTQKYAQELEQRVAERTAELKEQYRVQATQDERQRLARDLHDAVSQTLFSGTLLAEAIPRLWERYPERARQSLKELHRLNKGALAEMRNLLRELRPTALTEAPLSELLRHLADALAGRTKITVSLQVEEPPELPPDVKVALYRIAQEALNNITKHARANRADISLRREADQLVLAISDDGRGFDPQLTSLGNLGLGIMQERAQAIGAGLKINSREGQGTEIVVRWPITTA